MLKVTRGTTPREECHCLRTITLNIANKFLLVPASTPVHGGILIRLDGASEFLGEFCASIKYVLSNISQIGLFLRGNYFQIVNTLVQIVFFDSKYFLAVPFLIFSAGNVYFFTLYVKYLFIYFSTFPAAVVFLHELHRSCVPLLCILHLHTICNSNSLCKLLFCLYPFARIYMLIMF